MASLPSLASLRTLKLLGFALLGPACLPAGGAELRVPELRRRQRASEPLTAAAAVALRCSPRRQAPVIAIAASGEALRPLRRWCEAGGQSWLQVELAPGLAGSLALGGSRRGWLIEAES